jgi:molybdenum cofactor biosynthesis protein B
MVDGQQPADQHRSDATRISAPCAVVTLSDSRSEDNDLSGGYLRGALVHGGHRLLGYRLIADEPGELLAAADTLIADGAKVLLCTGGTGFGPRDGTIDTLETLWERRIPGFGELFRMLSFAQIGPAAMLSRAAAGIYRGAVIFALPGSPRAVELAWTALIEPELRHLIHVLGIGEVSDGTRPAGRLASPDRS